MNDIQKTIFSLHLRKSTGKLSLLKDETKKEIYFKKGNPIYVESNVRSEALGQVLVREGRITSEQLQQSLDLMMSTGKKQGECFVELKILTPFEVYQELEKQMGRKFQNCFLFEGAETNFMEGDEHLHEVPEFQIDTFHTILDFFSFEFDESHLESVPESKAYTFTEMGNKYFESVRLLPHESKIARLFDGKKTVQQMIDTIDVDMDFIRLFILVLLGFKLIEAVEIKTATSVQRPQEVQPKEQVVVIRDEALPEKKEQTSPIYSWALKLGRPLPDILEIKPSTPKPQIQRNYDRIVRELRLDQIDQVYSGKEKEIAQSVFDRLAAALAVFTQEALLKIYVQSQSNRTQELHPRIQAEMHIQKSKSAAQAKDLVKAESEITSAIEIDPKEPSYKVLLAELLMKKAVQEETEMPRKALDLLHEAVGANSNYLEAYFHMGLYYKLNKDLDKAIAQFNRCIEISPNHAMANSELRLLNKRRGEQKKPSSTPFAGLFKGKDKADPKKKK